MFQDIILIIIAYLLGSVSSAIITCRFMGCPDPRTKESRNPGATNVLRICGKKAAFITLVGDALKGTLPILATYALANGKANPTLLALVGLAAFLGHLYPLWFGFKGGKGVATALGILIGLHWMIGGAVAILWLITSKLTSISSLAALISMVFAPFILWLVLPVPELMAMQIIISLLLFWRHRSNISNLLAGTESQIGATD